MSDSMYEVQAIGVIHSKLVNLADAPKQGDEGNYEAWLEIKPEFAQGLTGITIGHELILLTWLHRANRDVLHVHPRGNPDNPVTGVFATRSPARPNPIGLHQVSVLEVAENRLRVAPLEAIDGTPIIDIKSILTNIIEER